MKRRSICIDNSLNKNLNWRQHDKAISASAFIADKKFLRLVMKSITPDEFTEITKHKPFQPKSEYFTDVELMEESITNRLMRLKNSASLKLLEKALTEGIAPALIGLYTYFKK